MRRFLAITWLVSLCTVGTAYAWEVPAYLRVNSGLRMWFTQIEGDLIQNDRTKLGITENLGTNKDKLVWQYFLNLRVDNIHLFRFRAEPSTLYESRNDSTIQLADYRLGYDLDFYMTPQLLFGANIDVDFFRATTRVRDVTAARTLYNYSVDTTRVNPLLGLHGTFYPIVEGIALRPNISARVDWWNYQGLETWDWEAATGVDIPVNRLWTWCINGGYRFWHMRFKSDRDTPDLNRSGFFIETSVLF